MSKQNFIEINGKTVEEAIAAGLAELNAGIADVDIEITEEGSKGLFGIFGNKPAKVKLVLKKAEEVLDKIEDKYGFSGKKEKSAGNKAEAKEISNPKTVKQAQQQKVASVIKESLVEPKTAPVNAEEVEKRAVDFLREVTKMMGTEVEIKTQFKADATLLVEMYGDELGILIGRHGETLDALQYITRLVINRDDEEFVRVILDSESYRAKREEALVRLANRMANRAIKTGRRVSLEPMNPYERRIIHSALQAHEGVETHSEGEEPRRHLVITVKR